MHTKHLTISLVIFNLIFIAMFAWFVHAIVIDYWFLAKSGPNFCAEETADGATIFVFCGEVEAE